MSEEEVLSEEEVDALMDSVESGEVSGDTPTPDGEVIPYDLTDQDRIVRGQLPVLEKIHATFVRQFEEGLEQMLQRPVEVSEDGLLTVRTSDYIHSLSLPVSLNYVELPQLNGEALIAFDPAMVFTIVDIYFGGSGKHTNPIVGRDFTPTESRIIQLILNQLLQDLAAAWEPVMPVTPRFSKSESDPEFSTLAGSREMLVIAGFRMDMEDSGGEFHIALPVSMIEPVRDLLDGGLRKSKSGGQENWLLELQRNLQDAKVDLHGVVARTRMTLRDVLDMNPGDVIPVSNPQEVVLQVGSEPVFAGQFGVNREHNAVKITGEVEPAGKTRIREDQE